MNRTYHNPLPYIDATTEFLYDIVNATLVPYGCKIFPMVKGNPAELSSAGSIGSAQKGRALPEISQRSSNPSDAGLGRDGAVLPRKQSLPSICPDCQGYGEVPQSGSSDYLVRCNCCRGKGRI